MLHDKCIIQNKYVLDLHISEANYSHFYLYTNALLGVSVCLSVRRFVPYRNYILVVQFQNQAHIRNPHDPAKKWKTTFLTAAEGGILAGRPHMQVASLL